MSSLSSLYPLRRASGWLLWGVLAVSALAFGAAEAWSFAIVACAVCGLAVFWAARKLTRPFPWVSSWLYLPLAVIPALAAAQWLTGATADSYATSAKLADGVVYVAFFAVLVNVLDDALLRRAFSERTALLGFIVSLGAILQALLLRGGAYGFRPAPGAALMGPFADAEHLAVWIELLFPGALLLALRETRNRITHFAFCVTMAAAVVLSGSAAGIVLLSIEFAAIGLAQATLAARSLKREGARWDLRAVASIAGLLALAAALAVGINMSRSRTLEAAGLPSVAATRAGANSAAWSLFLERPTLGHGLGAFGEAFAAHAPSEDGRRRRHLGNQALEWLVEGGVSGVLVPLSLMVILIVRRPNLRVWLGVILPLGVAWTHALFEFPFATPAVGLLALAVLAQAPSSSGRSVVRRRRKGSFDPGQTPEP